MFVVNSSVHLHSSGLQLKRNVPSSRMVCVAWGARDQDRRDRAPERRARFDSDRRYGDRRDGRRDGEFSEERRDYGRRQSASTGDRREWGRTDGDYQPSRREWGRDLGQSAPRERRESDRSYSRDRPQFEQRRERRQSYSSSDSFSSERRQWGKEMGRDRRQSEEDSPRFSSPPREDLGRFREEDSPSRTRVQSGGEIGNGSGLRIGMTVDMEIMEETPLGYNVLLLGVYSSRNQDVYALLYRNTLQGSEYPMVGEVVKGYVSYIRPEDGKVDVSLGMPGYQKLSGASKKIVTLLKEQQNLRIDLCDKSPPYDIEKTFGMSKRTFKQALGKLYKSKLITIVNPGRGSNSGYIELKPENEVPDREDFTPAQLKGLRDWRFQKECEWDRLEDERSQQETDEGQDEAAAQRERNEKRRSVLVPSSSEADRLGDALGLHPEHVLKWAKAQTARDDRRSDIEAAKSERRRELRWKRDGVFVRDEPPEVEQPQGRRGGGRQSTRVSNGSGRRSSPRGSGGGGGAPAGVSIVSSPKPVSQPPRRSTGRQSNGPANPARQW